MKKYNMVPNALALAAIVRNESATLSDADIATFVSAYTDSFALKNTVLGGNITEALELTGLPEATVQEIFDLLRNVYLEAEAPASAVKLPRFTYATEKRDENGKKVKDKDGKPEWETDVIDEISTSVSTLANWCIEHYGHNPFAVVDCDCSRGDSDLRKTLRAEHERNVDTGIEIDGVSYAFLGRGANHKGRGYLVERDVLMDPAFIDHITLGNHNFHITEAKWCAYVIGMIMAPTTSFEQNGGTTVKLNRVCCIDDYYANVIAKNVYFVDGKEVTLLPERTTSENIFDGVCAWKRSVLPIGASIRPTKGFGYPIDDQAWNAAFANGITDIDGNVRTVDSFDMIITKSCWKLAGAYKAAGKTWQDYVLDSEAHDADTIRALLLEHNAKHSDLPYQQTQALFCADTTALAKHETRHLRHMASAERGLNLLEKQVYAIVKQAPAFAGTEYVNDYRRNQYTKLRREALIKSRIHGISRTVFCSRDPLALVQFCQGEAVTGVLQSGEFCCPSIPEGEYAVSRNPVTRAVLLMRNVHKAEILALVGNSNVAFFNVHDDAFIQMRADSDGDHVNLSNQPELLSAIKRHNAIFPPFSVDWVAPETEKKDIKSFGQIRRWMKTEAFTTPSKLGLFMNHLNMLYGMLNREFMEIENTPEALRRSIAWLEWAVNVLVDSTKHGNVESLEAPADVKGFVELAAATKKEFGLPKYITGIGEYGNGSAGRYASFVEEHSPESIEEIPLSEEFGSSWLHFVYNPNRMPKSNPALTTEDRDPATHLRKGLFFRTVEDFRKRVRKVKGCFTVGLDGEFIPEDAMEYSRMMRYTAEDCLATLDRDAEALGITHEEMVDSILRVMNSWDTTQEYADSLSDNPAVAKAAKGKHDWHMQCQRCCIRLFGYEMAQNAIKNRPIWEERQAKAHELDLDF